MRRIAAAGAALLVAGTVAACSGALSGRGGSSAYRVSAVFDSARGVLPGGLVKIAGADVGTVTRLSVTPGRKALVQMTIASRFGPFRTDATCQIRSSGLVGERYVECDPGSPALSPPQPGDLAFVSLSHTSVPVDLSDFFDIWSVPVRERLTLLLNELGIATAGRGDDINALLRRANPTLVKADEVLAILDNQRRQLTDLVGQTDTALRYIADRGPAVRALIREGAHTFSVIGAQRTALQRGIADLPTLLGKSRASIARLDAFSTATVPVLDDFRAAAPRLMQLIGSVPQFASAALPAIAHLSPALSETRRAMADSRGLTSQLKTFASFALPTGRLLDELLVSARQSGAVDYLNELNYFLGSATSRYDAFSHLVPAALLSFANCGSYATTPAGGECQATYTTPSGTATGSARRGAHRRARPGRLARAGQTGASSGAASSAGAPSSPSAGAGVPAPPLPGLPTPPTVRAPGGLGPLMSYLFR